MEVFITTIPDRIPRAEALKEELQELGYGKVTLFIDELLGGPWSNVQRVLEYIAIHNIPAIILQDDVILGDQFARCQKDLEPYLEDYGLISFYTPRSWTRFDQKYGCNAVSDFNFWWAQGYMIRPEFAAQTLEVNEKLNQDIVGYIDEARYIAASGYYDVRMLTVLDCLLDHDVSIESSIGTFLEGFTARKMATEDTDYTNLKPFIMKNKPSYYYQLEEHIND